jgi:hypothetical protein
MKKLFFIVVIAAILVSCGDKLIDPDKALSWSGATEYLYMRAQIDVLAGMSDHGEKYVIDKMEYGYTEGRGDAREGDIRVKRWGTAGDWAWAVSPWDSSELEGSRHTVFDRLSEYEDYMER